MNSAFAPVESKRDRRDRMMYKNGGIEHFGMPTSAVNAYYSPVENSINILAGIIGPPFYDRRYTRATLFGTIGAVIGHELSHAFDSTGVHFDPMGSLTRWIPESDMKAYEAREACFLKRYNVTTRLGNRVDPAQTLGENIADTMGTRAALDAYVYHTRHMYKGAGRYPNDREFREFIEAYAQMWCTNQSPESEAVRVASDPHAPGGTRINGALSSLRFEAPGEENDPIDIAYKCSERNTMKNRKHHKKLDPCSLW